MDLMEIFIPVIQFFSKMCEVKIPIAGYDIPAGAFYAFAGIIGFVVYGLRSLRD